ncbi:MAG: ribosomal protein S18-alanine N-acetyltransferase [Clostridia bacterium]|nr:ribosomal protein S18-alanine N-acetyltransferase [Clostridia bacterium]
MCIVRGMTTEDIHAVALIEKECFGEPWSEAQLQESLGKDYARFLVAVDDGEVVGYVGAYILGEDVDITNVAVTSSSRGRGVAYSLMSSVMRVAREEGSTIVRLECRVSNTPARALYDKLGFESVGVRPRFYQDLEDAIMYEKHLQEV